MLGFSDISAFSVHSAVKLEEDIVISREKYFCNGSSALFTNFADIGVGWIGYNKTRSKGYVPRISMFGTDIHVIYHREGISR